VSRSYKRHHGKDGLQPGVTPETRERWSASALQDEGELNKSKRISPHAGKKCIRLGCPGREMEPVADAWCNYTRSPP
jgi:hypothetical protein